MRKKKAAAEAAAVPKQPSLRSDLLALLIKLMVIAAALFLLERFVFGVCSVRGNDMAPSIRDRDLAVYYRLDHTYEVRDVVAVRNRDGTLSILRVVATAGDRVDITSDGLRINGYYQQEDYAAGETLAFVGGAVYPITLADGEVFVLGDNREYAVDSRYYGPVRTDDLLGKIITTIRRRDF